MEPGPKDPEGKKASHPNSRNRGLILTGVGKGEGDPQRTGSRTRAKKGLRAECWRLGPLGQPPVLPGSSSKWQIGAPQDS